MQHGLQPTQTFFATVQNKLEFAITHMTGAAIIKSRANANEPNMGLQTWGNSPSGKVLKKDVTVAKNYLKQPEMDELNSIVVMYLDYAELQAKRNKAMKMSDWVEKLDSFLKFNDYEILKDAGKIRKSVADSFAGGQYEKFRVIQDRAYKSDFDKVIENIKIKGELPSEKRIEIKANEPLSDFNQKLVTALNYNPKNEPKVKKTRATKSKTKECPVCGKECDKKAKYCDGNIDADGDLIPCPHIFDQ